MPPLRTEFESDTFEHDPARWGASLANNGEFLFATLDAAGARSVAEVGAYAGDLTRLILRWAESRGATVTAVDPEPQPALVALDAERDDLELIRATSHEALVDMELTDAIILDGDHNYFTVAGELRLIAERSAGDTLPLVLFHDVGWPHARRDNYEAPEHIPAAHKPHPVAPGGGLYPGDPGIRPGALPMHNPAAVEGGPRNGVLTAIEDFLEGREGLRLAVIPSFFGFGALWDLEAPYADALATLLDPFDRNPVLERLEANRLLHLAEAHVARVMWREVDQRKVHFLRRLLMSRTFRLSQKLSKLARRGEPAFTDAEIQALLDETAAAERRS